MATAPLPLVGIISDTHDNDEAVEEAIEGLRARGIVDLVHCGDVMSASTLELFRGFRLRVCLGNNDSARELAAAAERLGGSYAARLDIEIGGKRFFASHGDHEAPLQEAIQSGNFQYVLYGHTHRRDDRRRGSARLINPGALYRAAAYSYAVLNTASDELEFVDVGKKG